MRKLLLSALLITGFAAPVSAQATSDTTALPADMRAARAVLAAAYEKLDAAAAASSFAPDAAIDFQGQLISGRDGVAAWFSEAFAGITALRGGTASYVIGDGEVTERSSYIAVPTGGEEQTGTSETVWRRQPDGTWKVARLIVH
ncbi:MAG TPA: nuclear transport factor 2 family protein [Longimicrobiales bacterium]